MIRPIHFHINSTIVIWSVSIETNKPLPAPHHMPLPAPSLMSLPALHHIPLLVPHHILLLAHHIPVPALLPAPHCATCPIPKLFWKCPWKHLQSRKKCSSGVPLDSCVYSVNWNERCLDVFMIALESMKYICNRFLNIPTPTWRKLS